MQTADRFDVRRAERKEVLWACHRISNDWCRSWGRDAALEEASRHYHELARTWQQRATWRMIMHLINIRVQSPSD